MTDWCLVECHQEVMYGSADNIVHWHNVPQIVILNVPEDIELTKEDLLRFLLRPDILGTSDHWMYSSIAGQEFDVPRPRFALIKLGGEMPDEEMRRHFTEGHDAKHNIYDWLIDNSDRKNDSPYSVDWYDPRVKNEYDFYKRYDILPPDGWEFWDYHLAHNQSKLK